MRFCSAAGLLVLVFVAGWAFEVKPRIARETRPIPELQGKKQSERTKVSVCELKRDPLAFNHKLVEVTGFISHAFEDFTLFDPECSERPGVWLEYAGKSASGTMYCCGVTAAPSREKPLVVENIPVELVDDARFQQFDKLLQRRPDSVVHATIVGRFFSGELETYANSSSWGGYGHMGCCTLLAIQEVVAVDLHDSTELDYGAYPDQPETNDTCTGYSILTERLQEKGLIKAQQRADLGQEEWAFTDPKRVAAEGLARQLGIRNTSTIALTQTRKAQGRFVYHWLPKGKTNKYMVVTSRPYLLSFYAKDPKRVAWVMTGAYKRSCGVGEE